MMAKIEEEQKPPPQTGLKTRKVGTLKVPNNLIRDLTTTIGADLIPIFLRYLKEMINLHPIKYLTQPRDIKLLIETDHFPRWLEKIGAA